MHMIRPEKGQKSSSAEVSIKVCVGLAHNSLLCAAAASEGHLRLAAARFTSFFSRLLFSTVAPFPQRTGVALCSGLAPQSLQHTLVFRSLNVHSQEVVHSVPKKIM